MFERRQISASISQPAHRRRWLPEKIAAGLLACLAVAWTVHWFGQLNAAEKNLIGEWSYVYPGDPKDVRQIRLEPDRTFVVRTSKGATYSGTWRVSGQEFSLSFPTMPPMRKQSMLAWLVSGVLNPKARQDATSRFALHDLTRQSVGLKQTDGNEIVFRRATADERESVK
jgi:hypothetical protein